MRKYVVDAHIHLAVRVIRKKRVDNPLIQSQFSCVVRDRKHIVNFWVYAIVNRRGPSCKLLNQLLLFLRRKRLFDMVFYFRHRQMKLVGGLDIGGFPEHGHQLRKVEEAGKACPGPVFALRGQLHLCHRFTEDRGPAIEVFQAVVPSTTVDETFFQETLLQIALHGK